MYMVYADGGRTNLALALDHFALLHLVLGLDFRKFGHHRDKLARHRGVLRHQYARMGADLALADAEIRRQAVGELRQLLLVLVFLVETYAIRALRARMRALFRSRRMRFAIVLISSVSAFKLSLISAMA